VNDSVLALPVKFTDGAVSRVEDRRRMTKVGIFTHVLRQWVWKKKWNKQWRN